MDRLSSRAYADLLWSVPAHKRRQRRHDAEVSMLEAASFIPCPVAMFARWESGDLNPPPELVEKYVMLLNDVCLGLAILRGNHATGDQW